LSLAFKTDRQTLDQRLDVHLRARDLAEENIRKELCAVRNGLLVYSTATWFASQINTATQPRIRPDLKNISVT